MVKREHEQISITSDNTEENKTILDNFFNENEIKFKFEIFKNKSNTYKNTCIKWGLPPFEDTLLGDYIRYYIDKKYKEIFCIHFALKIDNNCYIHFKKSSKPKFTYKFEKQYTPKYPIYVISHKRYNEKDCLTVKNLELLGISYYICIRKNQEEEYKKFFEKEKYTNGIILTIDLTDEVKGSTSQRNFCWEHSVSHGHKKFWLLDDNMNGWSYFNELRKVKINSGLCFTVLENIIDNTENVGIISHNYYGDVPETDLRNPLQHNCKNYSSLLINTELLDKYNIKFRLLYNEDVDLTLQVLSQGLNTLGTNFLLTNKSKTGDCKGGNQEIYGDIKTKNHKFLEKYKCLENEWNWLNDKIPTTLKMVEHRKEKIPHHEVDYKKVCKIFNVKEVIPLNPEKQLKTYKDFGITMIM